MQQHPVSHEQLMRHLDGESDAAERERVERHLAECGECRREYAIFAELKVDLGTMRFQASVARRSVWDAVNRRLTRPSGWILFLASVARERYRDWQTDPYREIQQ